MKDAQRPTIDPTEISISPVTMINVIGKATIAAGVMPASAIEMFEDVRKYRETCAPQRKVPIRTKRRNTSHRASKTRSQVIDRREFLIRASRTFAGPGETGARPAQHASPGDCKRALCKGSQHQIRLAAKTD